VKHVVADLAHVLNAQEKNGQDRTAELKACRPVLEMLDSKGMIDSFGAAVLTEQRGNPASSPSPRNSGP
jgi:hypothetical protein